MKTLHPNDVDRPVFVAGRVYHWQIVEGRYTLVQGPPEALLQPVGDDA